MSPQSPEIKPEESTEMWIEEEEDDDAEQEDEELGQDDEPGQDEYDGSPAAPTRPLLPVPTTEPLGKQPGDQSQRRPPRKEVPALFQNSGLVMRNSEGLVANNESTLPTEKSFTIQVGPKQFRLSGASIRSDAPSYFTRFFEAELDKQKRDAADDDEHSTAVRTLYVDRDPETFKDIALHLQGYYIQPLNAAHYVRLFADAQFYVLPRLIKHLYESDVYMRIGEEDFCIPRDLFDSPGNNPNYFTLGFSLLFSTPGNPFPGLNVSGLLRPPAIKAASASGRSSKIFADILDLLRGYEVRIRDEEHRAALLRDCRYYHLRGLEQKIVPHVITWNSHRSVSEIIMRVEDLRQSGLSVAEEQDSKGLEIVRYARPFVDDTPHELILESGQDSATIRHNDKNSKHFVVEFHGETRDKIMSLFKVVSSKYAQRIASRALNGATPEMFGLNEDGVTAARMEADALITVDGEEGWIGLQPAETIEASDEEPGRKRRRLQHGTGEAPIEQSNQWAVLRAQWRIRLESWKRGGETEDRNFAIHMYAVNLDLVKGQRGRSRHRGFLVS